jgi:hypothetical protein
MATNRDTFIEQVSNLINEKFRPCAKEDSDVEFTTSELMELITIHYAREVFVTANELIEILKTSGYVNGIADKRIVWYMKEIA